MTCRICKKRIPAKCLYSGKLITYQKAIMVKHIEDYIKQNGCEILIFRRNKIFK